MNISHLPFVSGSPFSATQWQKLTFLIASIGLFCTLGMACPQKVAATSATSHLRLAQMADDDDVAGTGKDDDEDGAATPSTGSAPTSKKAVSKTVVSKSASQRSPQRASIAAKAHNGGNLQKGDAIEAWDTGWYKARVLEIGTGEHHGYYLVRFDGYSSASDRWVQAKNIRVAPRPNSSAPPRAGKYLIMGYGGNINNPIHIGYFILSGGNQYRYYNMGNKLLGAGRYRFNATSKEVRWLSGPFKKANWGGKVEISRQGKTHTITINRATIGTNSTDSRR
jgi:hypothetical protein